jgi:hypothetical protein
MTTPASAEAPSRSRPGLWIVAALVAVAVALAVYFVWKPQWRMWCHGADKPEFQKRILGEQDPALADVMADVMTDADQPDTVRLSLGELLLKKNRVSKVEDALRHERLDVRVIALRTFSRYPYFRKQYVEDASWKVGDTFLAWLKDGSSKSRGAALVVLPVLYPNLAATPPAVVQSVRDLARAASGGASEVRAAAGWQLAAWDDCESAGALLELARAEDDPILRMRLMQAIVLMYDGKNATCRSNLPEADIRAIVARSLAHEGDGDRNRSVRMAAMQILARHTDWAAPHLESLRATVDGTAHEVERRTALETLAAAADAPTLARFARHFHDPSPSMRSAASGVARLEKGPLDARAFESCLIGLVRDETSASNEFAFSVAMAELRRRANRWIGIPGPLALKGPDSPSVSEFLKELFKKGSSQGVERAAMAEAWFRWLCERNGVKDADADAAVRARDEFWTKARAKDVAGAKGVYEANATKAPNLWTYERGWLLREGAIEG